MKKIFTLALLVAMVFGLAACGKKKVKVTFDAQNGKPVKVVEVIKGEKLEQPEDPEAAKNDAGNELNFLGWYKEAAGVTKFNFVTAEIMEEMTIYGVWVDDVVIRFNTKTEALIDPLTVLERDTVAAPNEPTRPGYAFKGWFEGKAGLTWLEQEAVKFPLVAGRNLSLHAYWEPLNSKTVSYSAGETYTSSITSDSELILNPLTYKWNHENQYMAMLATSLYSTEVDWDLAVKEGVASAPGDFSKIESKEFSIEALDYKNILVGATRYPVDNDGEEYLDADGNYDRDAASSIKKNSWTFHLDPRVKFEDGTPVTAQVYEFTLKQFLSKEQNNYRSNLYFKTEEDKNGVPLENAYEYFKGDKTWDEVGFEVIDNHSFKITTWEPISQSQAVGFGDMRLVHPAKFTASLTAGGTKSTYGTPESPFVSYGAYILKSWDENAKLVFNKNYDYVLKGTVNYKSQVIEVVDDIHQRMQLFEEGKLSVAGLNKDYYAQYNERPNVYSSWGGYPSNILINLAERTDKKVRPSILFNEKFRQALFYGFNRNHYAVNVYAPNTPSLFSSPLNLKTYIQDPLFYTESQEHLAVLEEFGISSETTGYMQDRAKGLFNEAYATWVAEGNSGKVVIELVGGDDDFGKSLSGYVKDSYEALFGADKLEIKVTNSGGAAMSKIMKEWDFDLSLNSIGFGSNAGVHWQYPAIAFMGAQIGGAGLGLSQPFDESKYDAVTNPNSYADYYFEEVEVDLTVTFNFLKDMGEDEMTEKELTGHLELFDLLKASEGKAEGIFKGPMHELANLMVNEDNPYDGLAKEPFAGATNETRKIVAAFERVFYNHIPVIPTVTRSDAVIYASNVVITWPEYSSAFEWGAARYRYLNTDADFS